MVFEPQYAHGIKRRSTKLLQLLYYAPLIKNIITCNGNEEADFISILLKEPFALKNSETVYFTSIFSTLSYPDIALIDNFDLTFFYFYFVFEVFDTIKF